MELILRAWKEPEPFGWQGRHFHSRTVSVWPKPLQQPLPPMYALGTSREASDFAARNHIGLGLSFGAFDAMGKVKSARAGVGSRSRTRSSTAPTS